jgi:hypothetical protein
MNNPDNIGIESTFLTDKVRSSTDMKAFWSEKGY